MLCCRYLLLTPPHLAGTEEHHLKTGMQPGTGMGHTSTGMGGLGDTGMGHHTGMGHTTGTGMGTTDTGYTEEGKETMGHKIKKMIPGGALRDERWWGRVG